MREAGARLEGVTGFRIKVQENGGTKLQQLLPNTNPWSGGVCGREDCVTCKQGGETKQDCYKRGVVYESSCNICNPEEGLKRTTGEGLADGREFPSIYVGESSRSLHERIKEDVKDMEDREEDSHMIKHWTNHHNDLG